MNPHLFVYGTLLSSARHPMGARLRRESVLVNEARVPGRLYRIAHYPGLVESPNADDVVHGEVYTLNSPASTFKWLDAYEGLRPGRHVGSEYQRVERQVRLASGAHLTAWLYLYGRDVSRFALVPDGRWVALPP
jgi:gamma-glutamylcyclotransferase (GGCT)/AIG2-like uncharacterized protein YtfP